MNRITSFVIGLVLGYGICSYVIMSRVEGMVTSASEKLTNKLNELESRAVKAADKITTRMDETAKKVDDTIAKLPFGR